MTDTGHFLNQMRATAPLVHNITNYVAMNIMANVLLAAGASPAMVHALPEVEEFAGLAQALSVNIGTLDPDWATAMEHAAQVMVAAQKPWVLDPVGVGATRFRQQVCTRLLALRPAVIRGNASEIIALASLGAGSGGATGKGADSADPVEAAEAAARQLAASCGAVVAVSGPVDYITDGVDAWRVANGHPLMPRITALGCALNGVIAAFLVGQPALPATVAALAYYGLAGERAAQAAQAPGGFQAAFLDALYTLTPQDLSAGAKVARA
ncbi:hydroxyethylthiazole kinase [Pseudotabrizicola algicola]|uniref:Hydroxyethylthiazole kinase n=1 Tax=Pseudotabrizicola algicola TaxID=2709381 RepID=A0A6B3RQD0_9RHOB|nr:hydroxyethylthiazole kinase [Pseudotabrizicola algicola]NEX46978.1 hydroxyethylthiazole kinase [Pseudotabrizicola algicola]